MVEGVVELAGSPSGGLAPARPPIRGRAACDDHRRIDLPFALAGDALGQSVVANPGVQRESCIAMSRLPAWLARTALPRPIHPGTR